MFRPLVIGTAALAIAGSSIVFAQQRYFGPRGYGDAASRFEHRHHLSAEDMAAFADARIAALRAGLELTPEQVKNWPGFEQALRDLAQLRIEWQESARECRAGRNADDTVRSPRAARRPHGENKRGAETSSPTLALRFIKASMTLKRIGSRCWRICCGRTDTDSRSTRVAGLAAGSSISVRAGGAGASGAHRSSNSAKTTKRRTINHTPIGKAATTVPNSRI